MAPNATNPTPGRAARTIHWLFPSRTHLAITIAVEMALSALGLPRWMHIAAAIVIHLVLQALGRFR